MQVHRCRDVDALIAFDFEDAERSSGGTRLAPDVAEQEVRLLARAMSYTFAVLGLPIGGAKAGVRATNGNGADAMRRYCAEIKPLIDAGTFFTGPDLGTVEEHFAGIRPPGGLTGVMATRLDGVPFEEVLTGFGVAVAADAALGGLRGKTVALEGFGKVGTGVAREVARRGGAVVAISTLAGCAIADDAGGFEVGRLLDLRQRVGDDLVGHLGVPVHPPERLFDVAASVLVPGARPGSIDAARAAALQVEAIIPAANVPYTREAHRILQERGIAAHADFLCNAGGAMGYLHPQASSASSPSEALGLLEDAMRELVEEAAEHPEGPFTGACARAERFLAGWRPADAMPDGPAYA